MEELIKAAKGEIPSLEYILDETWNHLELQKSFVKNNFGKVLVTFDTEATKMFRYYERKALVKLAKAWLSLQKEGVKKKFEEILAQNGWDKFIEKASQVFVEFGILVQNLEKNLGNMRKARGGKTFEKVLLRLLEFIDVKGEIPMGKAREELRRIDIVIPSIKIATTTPDRAIFLTCKRTLRERWKQEVPQARLNQRIYLLTIDESLSESKANEINQKGLIAFVRDELTKTQALQKMPWIRKLADLPKELKKI
ncbi:MAG: type II restriction endonuclease [Planctomycetota bacterium]